MMSILIADDEELVRVSVRYSIETYLPDVSVISEAGSGEEALSLCRQLQPDVLITDIRMGDMDGLTLTQEVKKSNSSCQVILLSGYADFSYAQKAIQLGVTEYLLKPVKHKELEEALKRCKAHLPASVETLPIRSQIIERIREQFDQPLTLEQLAGEFNYHPKYIANLIHAETGKSFSEFLVDLRISKAIDLLLRSDLSLKEIAIQVGYEDHNYFHRVFKKRTGKTPGEYKKDLFH